MNIYVGNLATAVSDDDLYTAFKAFGQVKSATVVRDKFTRESRGFGFVEMPVKTEAQAAITGLDGSDISGKAIKVNEARPREENTRGNFRGGRSGGSGGGGGSRRW